MPSKQEVSKFMDILAKACSLVCDFPLSYSQLKTLVGYELEYQQMDTFLDSNWTGCKISDFLDVVEKTVDGLYEVNNQSRYVKALAICIWMDQKVSYVPSTHSKDQKYFSVHSVVKLQQNQVLAVATLNTNQKETKIQLGPKFEVVHAIEGEDNRVRSLASRDARFGLNRDMNNVLVAPWSEGLKVENLILPYDSIIGKRDGMLKIAFLPLSDQGNILRKNECIVTWDGIELKGVEITGLCHPTLIENRFIESWKEACRQQADIVFAPEMLGTAKIEQTEVHDSNGALTYYNTLIHKTALEMLVREYKSPPNITILPSYWQEGINDASLIDNNGQVLAHQRKHVPFIDTTLHTMEALRKPETTSFILIHIPGMHRIVVQICAEFLDSYDVSNTTQLCSEFGATLVIVPSYTRGEQDFVNELQKLKCYGTTVIWGNYCGAVKAPRIIGGCSVAGTDVISRFSDACQCNHSCGPKRSGCVFLTSFPLNLKREKPISPMPVDVKHFLIDNIQQE